MIYTDMTDEEYDALDEELTRTVPKLAPEGSGWLAQRELRFLGLQNMTVNYLFAKAKELHKSPAQIIDELVSKDMTTVV
jgi:hypothetical protein